MENPQIYNSLIQWIGECFNLYFRILKCNNNNNNDNNTKRDLCVWYSHQTVIKGTGGLGIKRMSGDHPNHYIIENS